MNVTLRFFLSTLCLLFFIEIFYLHTKKKLIYRYSLIWLLMGTASVVGICFPDWLTYAAQLVGIISGTNALFLFVVGFAYLIILSLTVIVSTQRQRLDRLVQQYALLEKRLRELEHSAECEHTARSKESS